MTTAARHHDIFAEFLDTLRRSSQRPAPSITHVPDADVPGRSAVTITGPTREAVQAEINEIMDRLEGNSFAQFLNPGRLPSGQWASRGEIVVAQPHPAE